MIDVLVGAGLCVAGLGVLVAVGWLLLSWPEPFLVVGVAGMVIGLCDMIGVGITRGTDPPPWALVSLGVGCFLVVSVVVLHED